jgi:tetratricopeptide (TPR) repeat protein
MGRVYMMQKDYDHALAEFNTAQELSESDFSFVLPYIAEIYYIMRDFDTAKKIMNDASSLDFNPRLYPIIAQWRSSNDRT